MKYLLAFLLASSPALAEPSITAPLNTTIQCGTAAAQNAVLPVTDTVALEGTGYSAVFGFNRNYGGVISSLRLIRTGYGEADVIEARSTAGAGLQTSSFVWPYSPPDAPLIFNQGTGNAIGHQWGFGATLSGSASPSIAWRSSQDWTPEYADTFGTQALSPCDQPPYDALFDDAALDFAMSQTPTPYGGPGLLATHKLTWRARVDQWWANSYASHAVYLSRSVARAGGLRVYVSQPSALTGPLMAADSLAAFGLCPGSVESYCAPVDTQWVMMVWNIFGMDIGVVVETTGGGLQLRLSKHQYCADDLNDACGEIDVQITSPMTGPIARPAWSLRSYAVNYRIGTPQQLSSMGYVINGRN
jgi:hypothetical protein